MNNKGLRGEHRKPSYGNDRTRADWVVDLVFPRRCPVCDRPVRPFGAMICEECEEKLAPRKLTSRMTLCCRCGKPVADKRRELCPDCEKIRHSYERGCAVYRYRDVSGALYRLKYQGRREYADWMGDRMAARLLQEFDPEEIDALVPIPVSVQRERKRGYNQAAVLAERISQRTGIPVREGYLSRRTDTAVLRSMSAEQRRRNLKNAFIAPVDDVKSRIIMLIDDIYTTGATIDACAQQLQEKGASKVYYVTLAIGENPTPE